jgi:hypothetical protein
MITADWPSTKDRQYVIGPNGSAHMMSVHEGGCGDKSEEGTDRETPCRPTLPLMLDSLDED